jgi:hypothetical protein
MNNLVRWTVVTALILLLTGSGLEQGVAKEAGGEAGGIHWDR